MLIPDQDPIDNLYNAGILIRPESIMPWHMSWLFLVLELEGMSGHYEWLLQTLDIGNMFEPDDFWL